MADTLRRALRAFAALLPLIAPAAAQAQSADQQVLVNDNTYGVLPAGKIRVTPTGGTQTTLAQALSFGAWLSPVYPEAYGAKGNAATYFDGAVTSTFTGSTAVGSSTTPTAPGITTVNNNDLVLQVFAVGTTWTTAPATANVRQNITQTGTAYGLFAGDQTVATAGAVSAVPGTLSASGVWGAATIPLVPANGSSISYIASTNYQSSTNGPITLTKPTGVAAGDYLVACVANYANSATAKTILWMPSGFQQIVGFNNSNNPNVSCGGKIATASEPTSYAITYNFKSTSGNTAVLLDYRGVAGPENISQTLTSASANFSASANGDAICIASIYGASQTQQVCGTITAVNSSTSINVSFYLPGTASGLQFAFGTLDTTAFQTMLASAPCSTVGCTVVLGMKHYALGGSLVLPPNLAISFVGQGPGVPNTSPSYVGGSVPLSNAPGATQLQWLTQGLSQAAFTIGGTLHLTNTAASDVIKNLTLIGGVGIGNDGGGANGVALLNTQNAQLENDFIDNFYGLGIYIDGMAASNISDWIDGVYINEIVEENNALGGIQVGSSLAVQNLSAINILNSFLMANGGPGLIAAGSNVQGLRMHGNTIAWNNTLKYPSETEIYVSGTVAGGVIEGNYTEVDGLYGSGSTGVINTSAGGVGIRIGSNFYSNGGFTLPTYSAAGTALPTCSATNYYVAHTKATVTDANSCAVGTTYSSGGASRCDVVCTGGSWTETGAASY